MVETKFDRKIKVLWSDNGVENTFCEEFSSYLSENRIKVQASSAYMPDQNGVASCKNMHLLEEASTRFIEMNSPRSYWSDRVLTTTFLINQMSSRFLGGKSPFVVLCPITTLFGSLETVPLLFFFFVHILKQKWDKLDPKIFGKTHSNLKTLRHSDSARTVSSKSSSNSPIWSTYVLRMVVFYYLECSNSKLGNLIVRILGLIPNKV